MESSEDIDEDYRQLAVTYSIRITSRKQRKLWVGGTRRVFRIPKEEARKMFTRMSHIVYKISFQCHKTSCSESYTALSDSGFDVEKHCQEFSSENEFPSPVPPVERRLPHEK
ncbi:hypothetical protein NPIL_334411 [Nephila pilipes]|uniref:Uncharacterized protein n=1 Tax=Nephila pilipes TaxID=299642 RepID=A0A8X6NNL4_NEPPI|nr:hypothetical protein NPIL_334411 [Nephila pilipes]